MLQELPGVETGIEMEGLISKASSGLETGTVGFVERFKLQVEKLLCFIVK
jgi:hypothetical protein